MPVDVWKAALAFVDAPDRAAVRRTCRGLAKLVPRTFVVIRAPSWAEWIAKVRRLCLDDGTAAIRDTVKVLRLELPPGLDPRDGCGAADWEVLAGAIGRHRFPRLDSVIVAGLRTEGDYIEYASVHTEDQNPLRLLDPTGLYCLNIQNIQFHERIGRPISIDDVDVIDLRNVLTHDEHSCLFEGSPAGVESMNFCTMDAMQVRWWNAVHPSATRVTGLSVDYDPRLRNTGIFLPSLITLWIRIKESEFDRFNTHGWIPKRSNETGALRCILLELEMADDGDGTDLVSIDDMAIQGWLDESTILSVTVVGLPPDRSLRYLCHLVERYVAGVASGYPRRLSVGPFGRFDDHTEAVRTMEEAVRTICSNVCVRWQVHGETSEATAAGVNRSVAATAPGRPAVVRAIGHEPSADDFS